MGLGMVGYRILILALVAAIAVALPPVPTSILPCGEMYNDQDNGDLACRAGGDFAGSFCAAVLGQATICAFKNRTFQTAIEKYPQAIYAGYVSGTAYPRIPKINSSVACQAAITRFSCLNFVATCAKDGKVVVVQQGMLSGFMT